jgi:nucleotide-binding universal stress UspA family protein
MNYRSILLIFNSSTSNDWISRLMESALQHNAFLTCLMIDPAPIVPMHAFGFSAYGAMSVPDDWPEMVGQAQDATRKRVEEVNLLLSKSGAAGEVVGFLCATSEVMGRVARFARVCDEAIVSEAFRERWDHLQEVASGILYQSPIGFQVNANTNLRYPRAFIAWDASKSASASVHAALPYLIAAEEVQIACIDSPDADEDHSQGSGAQLDRWLRHRGCKTKVARLPSGGRSIGPCIEAEATEFAADLVVMGAYGHARLLQAVLGGTTRYMLEQTDLPVMFAH